MANDDDLEPDDDGEANPAIEPGPDAAPKSARAWLALIKRSDKAFATWERKSDGIDRLYANLEKLASEVRDREFQLFWANIQVLGPSVYSRAPVPVVVPAFRDQRDLPRAASEMLERVAVTTFRIEDIDSVMRLIRDDMLRVGRGAPWMRYSTENGKQSVCIEHVDRKDFRHDPARKWKEVDWVAKRSWLTKKQARVRFSKASGKEYQNAAYRVRKDDDEDTDGQLKAGFWELWSKSANKVVWVAEGCDKLLDEGPPHLALENFFPCPRPAYGTVQPGSLIPMPDVLFYKDQLEEINEITARLAALTQFLKLKGFYPAGATELGDAIEAAIKSKSDNAVLVPISNWAALGGMASKDLIIWLPLDMVATTITGLIALRKQLIDDVYQITGLSDIMRGDTDPNETNGAQQLKSQYGSIRVHDRQSELVRVARDITQITCEIAADNFSPETLLAMSQMEVPSKADITKQMTPLQQQLKQLAHEVEEAKTDPEIRQMATKNPDVAKQAVAAVQQKAQGIQGQLTQLAQTVTIEAIVKFLRDNLMRPFTLDIETDSTIAPDEAAQQGRATALITAVGNYLGEAIPMVQELPQSAPLVATFLKYIASQFRVGREIEGVIDKFADQMMAMGEQPKGPTPAQQKDQAEQQAQQTKNQLDGQAMQLKAVTQAVQAKLDQATLVIQQQKGQLDAQKQQYDISLATARFQLDQKVAASDAQIANSKNAIEATKHAGIEETKRQESALDHLTEIQVAEIEAKQDNDGQFLSAQLEREANLQQQTHEQVMQANEIEANRATASAAAAAPPAEPEPGMPPQQPEAAQ
ncbi:MAG TPA: hypothetical protein VIJ94_19935 [Caulobacteraceae bacterium]